MDKAELLRHQAAMQRLARIPGVVRVGYGLKQVAGRVIPGEPVYRVYVEQKLPISEVPADERIPSEIDGVKTDVLHAGHKRLHKKTPSIAPGDGISRYLPNDYQSGGTLGLIVKRGADRFILTNDHVLDDSHNLFDEAKDVYDPHIKTCAGSRCNNPVARIVDSTGVQDKRAETDGNTYWVDCTLATVNAGITGTNTIAGIGALDQGVRDLSIGSATGTVVKKKGDASGLTVGTVLEQFHVETDGSTLWELRITPTTGKAYSGRWELSASENPTAVQARFNGTVRATIEQSNGKNFLKVSGPTFSIHGDSGSAVVDEQRRVVGLLYAGWEATVNVIVDDDPQSLDIPTGDGVAAHILPVFHAMNLDPATAIIPPGSPSAGAVIENEAEDMADESIDEELALRGLEAAVSESEAGRRLVRLGATHYPAIAHLVHHRRRVMVVWHRNHGPAFAAAFLKALRVPGRPLPAQLGDIRLVDALRRFRPCCKRCRKRSDTHHHEFSRRAGRRRRDYP